MLAGAVAMRQRPPSSDLSSVGPSSSSEQPFAPFQSTDFHHMKRRHQPYQTDHGVSMALTTHHHPEQDISPLTFSKSSPRPSSPPSGQQQQEPKFAPPLAFSLFETMNCSRTNQQNFGDFCHDQSFGGFHAQYLSRKVLSAADSTVKPGLYGQKVGLIMGLRTEAMNRYLGVRFACIFFFFKRIV